MVYNKVNSALNYMTENPIPHPLDPDAPGEANRDRLIVVPSPLEAAFDIEIQRRFRTALDESLINEGGHIVRTSYAVFVGNKLVAFQYTRFDPLRTHLDYLLMAFKDANPSYISGPKDNQDVLDDEDLRNFVRELDFRSGVDEKSEEGKMIIDAIQQRIEEQSGNEYNPTLALTDPSHYVEGARLEQWPEQFEFVIFGSDNQHHAHVPLGTRIGRYGILMGRAPDVWGVLNIGPRFEGMPSPFGHHDDDTLLIMHPSTHYETARAIRASFWSEDLRSKIPDQGLQFLPFPSRDPFRISVHPDLYPPEKIMGQIGAFVKELCDPSQQAQSLENLSG